jgi:hypothetical protein
MRRLLAAVLLTGLLALGGGFVLLRSINPDAAQRYQPPRVSAAEKAMQRMTREAEEARRRNCEQIAGQSGDRCAPTAQLIPPAVPSRQQGTDASG